MLPSEPIAIRSFVDSQNVFWYHDQVMRLFLTTFLAAILVASQADADQNWPQFRGPQGDGTSTARGPFLADIPVLWWQCPDASQ